MCISIDDRWLRSRPSALERCLCSRLLHAESHDIMTRTQDELLDEVDRRIAGAEVYSRALTAAVIGLTGAGCDATEFETELRETRNALATLRRQRWAIPARAANP